MQNSQQRGYNQYRSPYNKTFIVTRRHLGNIFIQISSEDGSEDMEATFSCFDSEHIYEGAKVRISHFYVKRAVIYPINLDKL